MVTKKVDFVPKSEYLGTQSSHSSKSYSNSPLYASSGYSGYTDNYYDSTTTESVSSGFTQKTKDKVGSPNGFNNYSSPTVNVARGGESTQSYSESYVESDIAPNMLVASHSQPQALVAAPVNFNIHQSDDYESYDSSSSASSAVQKLQRPRSSLELPEEIAEMPDDPLTENRALRSQNMILRKRCTHFHQEIQKCLANEIRLETQLRNSKFNKMTDTDGSTNNHADIFQMGNTDLQKEILDLQSYNRQLLDERTVIKHDLDSKENENLELIRNIQELMHDIDYDEVKKMNRYNWWGTKKKHKAGEAAKTAAVIQDDLDKLEATDLEGINKVKTKEVKKKGALAEFQRVEIADLKKKNDKVEEQVRRHEEERIRLERDRAKFEGEVLILQKERWSDKDRLNKLEAHNELLKNQQRHAATETALTYSKAIKIPLPDKDGNTELDRLRVMVQIQEDALRRITVQKNQLQDMMDNMERHLPALTGEQEIRNHNAELSRVNQLLAAATSDRSEQDILIKRLKAKLHNMDDDNVELKKTVQHLSHNLSKSAQRDKGIKEKQATMIGHALTANEDLASQLAKMKMKNVDDLMSSHGEMRTVFSGRAREPTSEYALNKKQYPLVTAKRFNETNPTILKGSMISSVAQTDPMLISIPNQPNRSSSSSVSSEYVEEALSESSYAYTYIEEDLVVPREPPRSQGVQILVGGHQGLPAALRHSARTAEDVQKTPLVPGDEYHRIAKDERIRNMASEALKSWNNSRGVAELS
eukprot:GHVH01008766.1.p1 GENE.GHVH01008766.1~~GHVH01008766.1.p1  ORF type:complete len:759 (+),score=142.60 GHVH01008766.1:117-2393(+)